MTQCKPAASAVLAALEFGPENAKTNEKLARQLGGSLRDVRHIVEDLILQKEPIASSIEPPYGYFICKNWEQGYKYLDGLQQRIQGLAKRKALFKIACRDKLPPEQGKLPL